MKRIIIFVLMLAVCAVPAKVKSSNEIKVLTYNNIW